MTKDLIAELNDLHIVNVLIRPNIKLSPKEDHWEAQQNIADNNGIFQCIKLSGKSMGDILSKARAFKKALAEQEPQS